MKVTNHTNQSLSSTPQKPSAKKTSETDRKISFRTKAIVTGAIATGECGAAAGAIVQGASSTTSIVLATKGTLTYYVTTTVTTWSPTVVAASVAGPILMIGFIALTALGAASYIMDHDKKQSK